MLVQCLRDAMRCDAMRCACRLRFRAAYATAPSPSRETRSRAAPCIATAANCFALLRFPGACLCRLYEYHSSTATYSSYYTRTSTCRTQYADGIVHSASTWLHAALFACALTIPTTMISPKSLRPTACPHRLRTAAAASSRAAWR